MKTQVKNPRFVLKIKRKTSFTVRLRIRGFFTFFTLFLSHTHTLAQERMIQITCPCAGETVIIEENKRIRIHAMAGEKITGRYKIAGRYPYYPTVRCYQSINNTNPRIVIVLTEGKLNINLGTLNQEN